MPAAMKRTEHRERARTTTPGMLHGWPTTSIGCHGPVGTTIPGMLHEMASLWRSLNKLCIPGASGLKSSVWAPELELLATVVKHL